MTNAAAGTTEHPDQIGYADALSELESILDELDGDEVDVDVLGARVRRASELLRLCRERIAGARFEVEQVVGELDHQIRTVGGEQRLEFDLLARRQDAPSAREDLDRLDICRGRQRFRLFSTENFDAEAIEHGTELRQPPRLMRVDVERGRPRHQ